MSYEYEDRWSEMERQARVDADKDAEIDRLRAELASLQTRIAVARDYMAQNMSAGSIHAQDPRGALGRPMTPEEIAEMRARHQPWTQFTLMCPSCAMKPWPCDASLALDALEALDPSAPVDRLRAELANAQQIATNLRGELNVVNDHLDDVIARAEKAEARLAAVIALCDEPTVLITFDAENARVPVVRVERIRAAATGHQ